MKKVVAERCSGLFPIFMQSVNLQMEKMGI